MARSFSVDVVKLGQALRKIHESNLAGQLVRSGTSIGANIAEGRYPQTKSDYISKLSIALKEASETRYWIALCEDLKIVKSNGRFSTMKSDCDEIIAVLLKAVRYAKISRAKAKRLEALVDGRKRRKAPPEANGNDIQFASLLDDGDDDEP